MKRTLIKHLVTAKVKAENISIKDSLLRFKDKNSNSLKICSINWSENVYELDIEVIVVGEFEECLMSLKRLNQFLDKENQIKKFGYIQITTIPAKYEVMN